MPRTLQTVDEFQGYLKRAMSRALHHGHNLPAVVLLLAGAVLWKKEGSVEVRTHGSQTANCLWVRISGRRYAFSEGTARRGHSFPRLPVLTVTGPLGVGVFLPRLRGD